jgi:hypothetical protein
MRKFFAVLLMCLVPSAFVWAAPQASLIPVKGKKDPRVQHHRAHKATKHKAPKRAHHTV